MAYLINKQQNLIYDVGMCQGEDTEFYLRKGFKVIAFEANPDLVHQAKLKFSNAIKNHQLVIIEGAIIDFSSLKIDKPENHTVKFFKNKCNNHWGTVVESWQSRNQQAYAATSEVIEVPTVNFTQCLQTYGIPHYLKIDIEGMDKVCLEALFDFQQRPDYISIESEKIHFSQLEEEFSLLKKLGYNAFQAVNQESVPQQKEPQNTMEGKYTGYHFPIGASGLFGSDLPKHWKNELEILEEYKKIFLGYELFGDYGSLKTHPDYKAILAIVNRFASSPVPGWYDTHARHHSVTSQNDGTI